LEEELIKERKRYFIPSEIEEERRMYKLWEVVWVSLDIGTM
jgi:hypothetical protein